MINIEFEVSLIAILLLSVLVLAILLTGGGIAAILGFSFKSFFLKGLWAFSLPFLLVLWGSLIERNWYRVRRIEIVSASIPENFDGYEIAHISDIHLRSFAHRHGSLENAVRKTNALHADAIVFTGDMVTFKSDKLDGFESIIGKLSAPDGVISVMGNHDYCHYGDFPSDSDRLKSEKDLMARERKMGFDLLLDDHLDIVRGNDRISFIGVENISASKHFQSSGNLEKALQGAEGTYKILLSHDPTHWDMEVHNHKDIGLTLSGHTHAMQFSLFGFCPARFAFKEYRGLYKYRNQSLYVNIGLGETIFPARIGARPEITLITLKRLR